MNNVAWRAIVLLFLAACGQDQADTAAPAPAALTRTPSAEGARVFFIMPADGDVVASPVQLEFGTSGMLLVPAGDDRPGSGHHHVIIDSELPDFGLPVPKDDDHVHFGDGSSQAELALAPGQHTLQLLFADYLHIPHDPPVFSERITITVE